MKGITDHAVPGVIGSRSTTPASVVRVAFSARMVGATADLFERYRAAF